MLFCLSNLSLQETKDCCLGSAGTGPHSCDKKGTINRGTSSGEQRGTEDIGLGALSLEQRDGNGL